MMTDLVFRVPAIRLAEAQAAHQPDHTFMYRFDWPSNAFDGRLGSCHSLEIPFVFNNLQRPGVGMLTGPDAPQSIADEMHSAWIEFVRNDDPGGSPPRAWPPYEPAAGRATMLFDVPSRVEPDPDGHERELWEAHL